MTLVRAQIRSKSALALLLLSFTTFQACNDDGRTLREPTLTTALITTIPTTTTVGVQSTDYTDFFATTAWPDGGVVPEQNSCDGEGLSPSVTWGNVPANATAIGIVVTDSTEILADGSEYILWVATIPLADSIAGIPEGGTPDQAVQGLNSTGGIGWVAPCPPAGKTHRIDFTVFAMRDAAAITSGMSGNDMRAAIIDAAIDEFTVSGSYSAPE